MLNAMHNTFVQTVEHEFRTPLAIVIGYAEMLRSGSLGELAEEQQHAADRIAEQAGRLRRLVERVGMLLSATEGRFVREPVDLNMVATGAVDARWQQARAAGIRLTFYRDPAPLFTEGDSQHLLAACDSLVENAIKFTGQGGEVSIWTYVEHDRVCLAVRDTGIGIPDDQLPNLFAGFYQADMSMTRRYDGMGLGLTLANSVVTAHGGYLSVDSVLGQGSCFTLALPALAAVQPSPGDRQDAEAGHPPPTGRTDQYAPPASLPRAAVQV